jgi:hypothetical protein
MMPMPSSDVPEIDSVSQGTHELLWVRHRALAISAWAVALALAALIFFYVYFVQGDTAIASLSENDGTGILPFLPLLIPLILWGYFSSRARREMLEQIAKSLGFTYAPSAPIESVSGALFSMGHSRKIFDVLSGTYRDFPARAFTFQYTIGYGKGSHTYMKTVFSIAYPSALPHILLDSRDIFGSIATGVPSDVEAVELEGDFGKHFKLYVSKGAQIEVREIFQPDLMQLLIGKYSDSDFEISQNVLSVMSSGEIITRQQFMTDRDLADSLIDSMIPGLRSAAEDTVPANATA